MQSYIHFFHDAEQQYHVLNFKETSIATLYSGFNSYWKKS